MFFVFFLISKIWGHKTLPEILIIYISEISIKSFPCSEIYRSRQKKNFQNFFLPTVNLCVGVLYVISHWNSLDRKSWSELEMKILHHNDRSNKDMTVLLIQDTLEEKKKNCFHWQYMLAFLIVFAMGFICFYCMILPGNFCRIFSNTDILRYIF